MTLRFAVPPDPRPDDIAWPEMRWPPPADLTLSGDMIDIRQARPDSDAPLLFAALDDDRVWAHMRGRPDSPEAWAATLRERAAMGWLTWIVTLRDGRGSWPAGSVIGTSTYLEVAPVDARLEIGATAYAPDFWATRVNPEAKLLLLRYAFEQLHAGRVQLKTDIRNQRSAQAISRLGAQFEGVLRRYQRRADDTVRDTVVFSVLAEQWPSVRDGLTARLADIGDTATKD